MNKDDIEIVGGGTFGVVVEANWTVCSQRPLAGEAISESTSLTVDRTCGDPSQPANSTAAEPTPSGTATAPSTPAPKPVSISVDALFDKLNAGDTQVGDRFRITGVLAGSEYWGVGASGEFSVLIEAKGGANDLMVFIDKAKTEGWRNGTRVQFVVEDSEVTIDGETSGGWLRAISAKTL